MKKKYILLSCLFSLNLINAQQNLIPNPSFESYNSCPEFITMQSHEFSYNVESWNADTDMNAQSSYNNTPEYYNECDTTNTVGVPQNSIGYQAARTGSAYIGLSYTYTFVTNEYKTKSEVIYAQLTEPLLAGESYTFSMHVSLADMMNHSINKLGAAFVSSLPDQEIFTKGEPLIKHGIIPQIASSSIIKTKNIWSEIKGSFIAEGGERYVIIGNFHDYDDLEIEQFENDYEPGSNLITYYYIDDVSLRKGTLSNSDFEDASVTIFPNPTDQNVFISGINSSDIKTIKLYDMSGKEYLIPHHNDTLDLANLSSGIYILKIETVEGGIIKKKIMKK
ncbi:T9SS type A sorting domain-containing protein [Paenimyroides ceti]